MLANVFITQAGKDAMQRDEVGVALVEFCSKSFSCVNQKVQLHAALVLFNYLLCYVKESKRAMQNVLETTMKAIDEAISNEALTDDETLIALLLCECRILYKNTDMVPWVEESFKLFFVETHNALAARSQSKNVKEAVADVLSMVNLEDKK